MDLVFQNALFEMKSTLFLKTVYLFKKIFQIDIYDKEPYKND